MRIIEIIKADLASKAMVTMPPQFLQAREHQALIEFENNSIAAGMKVYGAKAPKSFIGDYLNSVAF